MSPYGVEVVARRTVVSFVENRAGGTLISWNVVLTSANAIYEYSDIIIRLGSYLWNYLVSLNVSEHIIHPEYRSASQLHDIALLRIPQSVEHSKKDLPIKWGCRELTVSL